MKLLINTLFVVFSMSICFGQINQVDAKGKKQGPWEKTYPDSKVYMYKGQFKNDRPVDKFVYFYPSSKVKAVINHDVTTGRSEAYYYHENQALMSFGIYRNLKKDSIVNIDTFDNIIIGGSIHAGMIQTRVKKFVENNIEIIYKRNELSYKNLLLVNKIIKNNTREIKKKTICLPIGNDRSKKEIKFLL